MRRFSTTRNAPASGFTLLEVIIVTAILAILLTALGSVFITAEKGYETSLAVYTMETQTNNAARRVFELLRGALILGAETHRQDMASIVFQVPIDAEGDGNCIDDTSELKPIDWGAPWPADAADPTEWRGQVYRLRFLKEEIDDWSYDEAEDNCDYNQDGDQNDSFARGRLVLEVFDAETDVMTASTMYDGETNPYPGGNGPIHQDVIADRIANLISLPTTWDGRGTDITPAATYDMNNDGTPDQMFLLEPINGQPSTPVTGITFGVSAFFKGTDGIAMMKRREINIQLRNNPASAADPLFQVKVFENGDAY